MQIQVNTDDNVEGRTELARRVEAEITDTLSRFSDHITRVEVHLSDENSEKAGTHDKRCLMEARLAGRRPIAVSNTATSLGDAFSGAADKLKRALESTFGRVKARKGRDSIRGGTSDSDARPEDTGPAPRESA